MADQEKKPSKKAETPPKAPFKEIVPWGEPVVGEEVLDAVMRQIKRFVITGPHEYVATTLWTVLTHVHDCFDHSPILAVMAPTMRSGKTTTLTVIKQLVRRPLPTSSLTQAIFRTIEEWRPTLIADEADTYLEGNKDL
jgi:putative DNA primase/helicase